MPVRLNDVDVDWARQDLSYLQPDAYRRLMRARLAGTPSLCTWMFSSPPSFEFQSRCSVTSVASGGGTRCTCGWTLTGG